MGRKNPFKTKKQRRKEREKENIKQELAAGQISRETYDAKRAEVLKDIEKYKKKDPTKIALAAGLGMLTGGGSYLGGLGGAIGGYGAKDWRGALTGGALGGMAGGGLSSGLGISSGTGYFGGGGLGGMAQRGISGLLGKGGGLGRMVQRRISELLGKGGGIPLSQFQSALGSPQVGDKGFSFGGGDDLSELLGGGKGGGGGMGGGGFDEQGNWLSSLGDVAGLYGQYQQYQQAQPQLRTMGDLQTELLKQLGDEDQMANRYASEYYQQAEPRIAASLFERGLAGSSAYGTGMADLARESQWEGEKMRRARQQSRLETLGAIQKPYQQLQKEQTRGLTGLGDTFDSIYNVGKGIGLF